MRRRAEDAIVIAALTLAFLWQCGREPSSAWRQDVKYGFTSLSAETTSRLGRRSESQPVSAGIPKPALTGELFQSRVPSQRPCCVRRAGLRDSAVTVSRVSVFARNSLPDTGHASQADAGAGAGQTVAEMCTSPTGSMRVEGPRLLTANVAVGGGHGDIFEQHDHGGRLSVGWRNGVDRRRTERQQLRRRIPVVAADLSRDALRDAKRSRESTRRSGQAADAASGSSDARGRGVGADTGEVTLALLIARSCFLESGWSEPDCAAQFWIWRKTGLALDVAIDRYERGALRANNPHAREARELTWGDRERWTEADNRRWARLRSYALKLLSGGVPDPHPRARNFGSRTLAADVRRAEKAIRAGRWIRLPRRNGEAQDYYAQH